MPDTPANAPKTMPSRKHHSAPQFDGEPASLSSFLDEVAQLAEVCGLSLKQTIEWAVRYAPSDEKELWQMQESVGTANWEGFKQELYDLYPGSSGERKYSVANLSALTEKQASGTIQNAKDFGTYKRSFLTIATYLKNKKKLSDREISIYFTQGLDNKFRAKVKDQLKAENPKHHTDDPYTLAEISTAALFVLSCDHTMDPEERIQEPTIKKEHFDMTKLDSSFLNGNINVSTLVSEIVKQLGYSPAAQRTQASTNNQRNRSGCCNFCSDPEHFLKGRTGKLDGCKIAVEYLQRGLCKANDNGYIVLPNGDKINAPGKDIKERLDNWMKANGATGPSVSTNFVGTEPYTTSGFIWTEVDADEEPAMTKREAEEITMLENLVASTQKKIDKAKQKGVRNPGPNTRSQKQEEKTPQEKPFEPPKKSSEPQFRYTTPIEDPALVKEMAQKTLEVPITMSTRELLSVSPDVRRYIKDLLTTKRTTYPATAAFVEKDNVPDEAGVFMHETCRRDEDLIVAKEIEELRALDVTIEGVKMEAVADDGSQIISIKKSLWERMGVPVRSDHVITMESANKSKNETLGLLQDLKILIGGYAFYVQAQVVEDAPYELLLGRPFFTLTQATHRHFSNGESHLTLVDPNTHAVITIPTRARKREGVRVAFQSGF
jgi:hypothetical protein